MQRIPFVFLVLALVLPGCAAKKPVTDWYYSSWTPTGGTGSEGSFDDARAACLAQGGVRDPATVEIGGETETDFVRCMYTKDWCLVGRSCD